MMESATKLRCTEETDFVVLNYDQSDIEEIEECPENLEIHSSTNFSDQLEDENTPTNSIHKDDSHSDGNDVTHMVEINSEITMQRMEKQEIHGSQSGLSNYSDTEPVSSSFDKINPKTCTISPSGDNGLSEDEEDEDGDDEDEINQIIDLTTIKRHRAYRHIPNSTAKLRLNLTVCFVITAGIFLGLGNYLGWSANWTKTKTIMTLNDNHIAKLKSLQDELAACINSQSKGDLTLEPRRRKRKEIEGEEVIQDERIRERELKEREFQEKEKKEIEIREIMERERIEEELREEELKERKENEMRERELRVQRDRGERRERREKKKKEDKDERKREDRKKEERKREERDRKKKRRDKERKEDL